MGNVLDRLKSVWRSIVNYVSPTFIILLCASFILWYILKLQYTYTTNYLVPVVCPA